MNAWIGHATDSHVNTSLLSSSMYSIVQPLSAPSFKAIGGSGVKKTCQAYFVELIAVVSTLFTCVKIQLGSEDKTNSIFRVLTVI